MNLTASHRPVLTQIALRSAEPRLALDGLTGLLLLEELLLLGAARGPS